MCVCHGMIRQNQGDIGEEMSKNNRGAMSCVVVIMPEDFETSMDSGGLTMSQKPVILLGLYSHSRSAGHPYLQEGRSAHEM